jgi:Family of unknown function (DUF6498)
MRWLNVLFVLALNAIPFYGAMYLGWSISTILALFWVENVMIIAATGVRIVLHRRWTRKCGHWSGAQPQIIDGEMCIPGNQNSFLSGYLSTVGIFTFAHGIFVVALVFGMDREHPDQAIWRFSFDQFRNGVIGMAAVLIVDLLADFPRLHRGTFAWLKNYVDRRTARVFILHIALIFGMLAVASTHSPFGLLGVLIGLKALIDVSTARYGESDNLNDLPAEPPAWTMKMVGALGKKKDDPEKFLKKWHDDFAKQRETEALNEKIMLG